MPPHTQPLTLASLDTQIATLKFETTSELKIYRKNHHNVLTETERIQDLGEKLSNDVKELRTAVEELRREVEELKGEVRRCRAG